ncbi:MAG TPA: hydrogenase maturation protease [Ktedonobacteraceae bacterium]|jgi:hydrogenase maturation protease
MQSAVLLPLVIGIGNEYRGDDALGLVVARMLRARTEGSVRVVESAGDCTTLLETWKQARKVLLVDAVLSGARPGTIHRFDVSARAIPSGCVLASTHAFGLADTLALAHIMGQLPPDVLVYGLEGERFAVGEGLSPAVQHALPSLIACILADIDCHSPRWKRRGPSLTQATYSSFSCGNNQ